MLNKLWLCHNIFGEAIGVVPTHTKLRDLNNTDFLLGVQFDIKEVLEAYKYGFSAELLETTNDTYYLSFGDEVHEYTFEKVR